MSQFSSIEEARDFFRKDLYAAENGIVLDEYTESLGCGIVNIVNMFRPQAILLGGLMTEYAAFLIDDLKKIMQEQCFGGRHGMIPDIACAKLGKEAAIIGAASL